MTADMDHLPDRGPVRKLTLEVSLRRSTCVVSNPDRALLAAWALVMSGISILLGRGPVVYNTVQAQ
jgi:hypothetical protein